MLRAGLLVVVMIAVAAPATAQKVTVKAATPSSAAQGTVNLDVLIDGSGFGTDSVAQFHVSGTTNSGGIRVNRTTRLSNAQLIANIDVDDAALLSYYDVKVVSGARTGKGTDLFQVVQKSASCLPIATPQFGSPLAVLNTSGPTGPTYRDGFGHRLRVSPVTRPDGSTVLVVFVPNRNQRAWVFVIDPVTLGQLQVPQEIVLPTLPGAAGAFFPQYGVAMGDFDGNGVADFAMANTNPGTVYVVTGRMHSLTGNITYSTPLLITTRPGDTSVTFGAGLGVGDLDGMPGDELLIQGGGARVRGTTYPNTYHLYRFAGTAEAPSLAWWRTILPDPSGQSLGGFGVVIADVDRDGDGDIVAGAPGRTVNGFTEAGQVLVFTGPELDNQPTMVLTEATPSAGAWFGDRLTLVPSLLGGSHAPPTLLVNARAQYAAPRVSGHDTPLLPGPQAGMATFAPEPGLVGMWAYHAMDGTDLNGDGVVDIGVSASGAQRSPTCATMGTAHIFLSQRDGGGAFSGWTRVPLQPPAIDGSNDDSRFSTGLALVAGYSLVIVGDSAKTLGGVPDAGQVYVYRLASN